MSTSQSYDPAKIEPKWQEYWLANKSFAAVDLDETREKLYVLDMFPYPSGAGLHVGHPEGYTATDIFCRYKRMKGYNVLHTMGWDAFGLPAEQYAMQTNTHPAVTTNKNIDNFRRQIRSFGFSYDWDREVNTTDQAYYKWTQWIFCQLYKKGLAYIDEVPVNWCPALGTVLANEEVINGLSERGNHPVVRKPMRQWMLKITEYAERLLADIDDVDWPEGIKEQQRNWIGKSVGGEVDFTVAGSGETIRVYTTRPDTLFGATYMVLSPEHALLDAITTDAQREAIAAYQATAAKKSDLDRAEAKEKTGVFTGAYAINPVNGQEIPIWTSDYVLVSYGTGAIMSVPAHDTRDFEFAQTFDIPIACIMEPDAKAAEAEGVSVADALAGNACWPGDGKMINSANDEVSLDGLPKAEAIDTIVAWLEGKGIGTKAVNYKLRDWLFSRQRYWGEPFPVAHMEDGSIKLLDEELPVVLPEMEEFAPSGTGESPLANASDWLDYTDPETGMKGRRETNTMPQWAGSCWYYLRYIDSLNTEAGWDAAKEKYWMPVDLYVGGAEHAVLHLLYARFWHKVLFDCGFVSTQEPFQRLINQGMILGISYKDERGALVPNDLVEERDGAHVHTDTGEKLTEFAAKMSKSLKNVVNPDDIVGRYGADAFRLYEMFMGPLTAMKPWQTKGVDGVYRFLHRAWKMIVGRDGELAPEITDEPMGADQERLLHQTIKKVDEDTGALDFNTGISQMMIFVNEFSKAKTRNRAAMEAFVQILAPYAPHIGEELWQVLGHDESLVHEPYPVYDEAKMKVAEVEILVQVLGKPKARLMVPADADAQAMQDIAMADDAVQAAIEGKRIIKVIAVPGRLVNIVAK